MIDVKNINIIYPKEMLINANISLYENSITCIIGPSGCGKTTLLQELSLLGKNQFDEYHFNDIHVKELSDNDRNEIIRNNICFIMQDIYLFESLTIREAVTLYSKISNKDIDETYIYDLLDKYALNVDIDTPVSLLSGGERQRLSIACGLIKDAELFVFDEPFAYLDEENTLKLLDIIKELAYKKNKIILVSTHNMEYLDMFDNVYEMKNKELCIMKETVQDKKETKKETSIFSFQSLRYYISLMNNKNKVKIILNAFLLSFILSLLIVTVNFNHYFQQSHGDSVMNLLNNQVMVIQKDMKELSPRQQTLIKGQLEGYDIYPEMIYEMGDIILVGYIDKEMDKTDIYKDLGDSAIDDNDISENIYISYSLYRIYENNPIYIENMKINGSKVLSPSENNGQAIYIPHEYYINFMKTKGIDMSYEDSHYLKVPISSLEDIDIIESKLSDEFSIYYEDNVIKESIDYVKIINKDFILGFIGILFGLLVVYKTYDFIKISKDIVLLKVIGVSNKNISKMKMYQESYSIVLCIILNFIFTFILMVMFNIFNIKSFIEMLLIVNISNIVISALLILLYTCLLMRTPVSILLRQE